MNAKAKRAALYAEGYRSGLSCEKVAEIHGVSRQCVQQALSAYMPDYAELRKKRVTERRESKRSDDMEKKERSLIIAEAACQETYGCSIAEYEKACGDSFKNRQDNHLAKRYRQQASNAKRRKIVWALSFPIWASMLVYAGVQNDKRYVIGRRNTLAGFIVGNVEVKTASECARDAQIQRFQANIDFVGMVV